MPENPDNAESSKRRPPTDWPAVHRDYATDKWTDRELGRKHSVSHTTIARRAERESWTKDLTEPIRRATEAAVIRETVTTLRQEQAPKVAETVAAAAELNKQVILSHRKELRGTREVATALLAELSGSALLAEHMDVLAAILAGNDAKPADEARAREAVQRSLGITSRISGVKGLAEALTKLHAAERIAFALDAGDQAKQSGAMAELLDRMKRSALPVQPLAAKPDEGDEE